MNSLESPPREPAVVVADTGFFIACGRAEHTKYAAVERFARRIDLTVVIPERVYEELGGSLERSSPSSAPIDDAIEAGWVRIAEPLDYSVSAVSAVMDEVRRRIANASNRSEDVVEKADSALAGAAVHLLRSGDTDYVYIVTTDVAAGEGVVAAVQGQGFVGQIEFVDGFQLIDDLS